MNEVGCRAQACWSEAAPLTGSICFRVPHQAGQGSFSLHCGLTSTSLQSTYFPSFQEYWSLINVKTLSQHLLLKNLTCNTHPHKEHIPVTSTMASPAMLDSLVCVYGSLPPELTSPLEGLAVLQKETELTILFIHSSSKYFLSVYHWDCHNEPNTQYSSLHGRHSTGKDR